ncbi:uncharacterized protein FIBRA_07173 [Fibroporia radiculosa]|uniref:Terpene synthase n=1 Tax=Fibroporia radiculosa TaxID=599839 RepID=J4GUG6_9APHY|nr:uncharacterized protein FIBRA_07173 [Fibroporia radiculosa]CCM04975.1 predicted protein [Fibroporia radiculosa]
MSSAARQFVLPDLLAAVPFKGATSQHYTKAAAESSAWVNSYNLFGDRKRAEFIQGSNELLVSHTYPYADYEQFRTCCDFVNLLFVVDEVSDEQNGKDARATGEVYLNAMRHQDWDDGSALSKMTREFKARLLQFARPGCFRRFLKHCEDYVENVAKEAEYRECGHVPNMATFEPLRRENSAVRLCFGLFEYCYGADLPEEVFEDSVFMELYWAAADVVCWSNDIYSYNMEQAKGLSGNNIVTVLMQEKGVDLQTASNLVGVHCRELMDRFVAAKSKLRSWGPAVDPAVAFYVRAMEHWVIGNLEWSFESQRYFGVLHAQVKETRVVHLRPCAREDDDDSQED